MKKRRPANIGGKIAELALFRGALLLGYTQSAGGLFSFKLEKAAELARIWIHEGVTLHLHVRRLA